MPKDPSTPPRSPKRKRNNGLDSPPLQTTTSDEQHDEDSPQADSPRTQVTEGISKLNIRNQRPDRSLNQSASTPRKRLKRQPPIAKALSPDGGGNLTTQYHPKYDLTESSELFSQIEETPDCRERGQGSPSRSPMVRIRKESLQAPFESFEAFYEPPLSSPPHSAKSDDIVVAQVESGERSLSPLPQREDLDPDEAALTWQEDEITGYEIDSALGDDGEGINGIGFRPTAAVAYARKQKRKQQVNEWKTREAREARQKRFERRRGAAAEAASRDLEGEAGETKRLVRFAGVG